MKRQSINHEWILQHGMSTIMDMVIDNAAEKETVNLPHDSMVHAGRSADAPSGSPMAFFNSENVEYRKNLYIPREEYDMVHYLNFDGIHINAAIYINDVFVTRHFSGYAPCTFRIDQYIQYDAENRICVKISGTAQPNARWYPGQGIYRDAALLCAPYLHVLPDGLRVTTVDCDETLAVLNVEAEVTNLGTHAKDVRGKLVIRDKSGTVAAERSVRFYINSGETSVIRKRVTVDRPALWNVETPELYTCEFVIVDDGVETDRTVVSFGIRKLQLDSRNGLRINGKSVKLKGGCLHHDNGILGAVSVLDAELRRIQMLKEAGYNAVRTAHNPPSTAMLDACDRLGMLVMDEFTDVWTEPKAIYDYGNYMPVCWEKDLEVVIRRDYNHPSVILWSIGNEIVETGNSIATQWGRKMIDKVKALDSSRYVTNGINVFVASIPRLQEALSEMAAEDAAQVSADQLSGGINDAMNSIDNLMSRFAASSVTDRFVEESCDMLDVVGYNYTAERYEREHPKHPDWVFVGTETRPPELDVNWAIVKRNPYALGDFCWTAWDYMGEVGVGRLSIQESGKDTVPFLASYPWIAAYCADFDLTGFRRPISYWREIVWGGRDHSPYIAVQRPENYGKAFVFNGYAWTDSLNSWTWPGHEGQKTAVEVYSDAEEVELFVNGVSQGRKPVKDDFKQFYCKWEVTYYPGTVEAVAYTNGEKVGRYELKTAKNAKLCAHADKLQLRAGSNDLCHIEIELRDLNGTMDMRSDRLTAIHLEGPVALAGFGSGDPKTEESYQAAEHRFFEGRLLAILKPGMKKGSAVVTISSEGLEPAVIKIEVE